MLTIEHLKVMYGEAVGLQDFSLSLARGGSIAVIGPNGAGKTSLLRAIAGFLNRKSGMIAQGNISVDGESIAGLSPYRIARRGIVLVPERDKVFTSLTVKEQLGLAQGIVGKAVYQREFDRSLTIFPNLKKHLNRPAGYLSGGERQMLSLASALCTGPKLLLIDELSQGLAPAITESLVEQIRQINGEGMTVLIVEQNVSAAAAMAKEIFVLDAGCIVTSGPSEKVVGDGSLTRTYLGIADGLGA